MSLEVGKQLRAVRTAFGLSQRELAKRAGVTNGMVSLIEQSRVSPSRPQMIQRSKVLDRVSTKLVSELPPSSVESL